MRGLALSLLLTLAGFGLLVPTAAGKRVSKPLQIYLVDVEGGQATLIVSPSGQSILIDTGWPGFEGRDAKRIVAAAHDAGIKMIDLVLITHHHRDHVGGVPQLVAAIKVGTFVDHGPNLEDADVTRSDYAAYQKAIAGHPHVVLTPGRGLPIKGISFQALTAAGDEITSPLPGAGEGNPNCSAEPEPAADPTENARSLGTLLTYGKFRFLDLGDLTKKKELGLVCPNDLIGGVDVYMVTHHGLDLSNAKPLVWAVHPRVALMDNGAHKGGSPSAWQTVHDSPGLEDLWQLHYAADSDSAHNVSEAYIANTQDDCGGRYIKVVAEASGAFTITNSRTGFQKTYAPK
jgi:competence protein ComEC